MRLIDADAFKKYITDGIDGLILPKDQAVKVIAITKSFIKDIDEQPTVERPHGDWIGDTDFDGTCKCSICRMTFDTDRLKMVMCDGKYEMPPCCPNCGSDNRKRGDAE